jgi:hypothetical protein
LLAPTGRVVLLYHAGGDAPALAHRQAVPFGPGPDITRALAASRGPAGPAGLRPADPAGVLKVGGELLAELGGVLGVQVDLIVGALGCTLGRSLIAVRVAARWPGRSPAIHFCSVIPGERCR